AHNKTEATRWTADLDIRDVDRDLKRSVEIVVRHHRFAEGPIGVVGFSLGGQLALHLAATHPETIGACVDFYGIKPGLEVDESKIRCPILGIFAERDGQVKPEEVMKLK